MFKFRRLLSFIPIGIVSISSINLLKAEVFKREELSIHNIDSSWDVIEMDETDIIDLASEDTPTEWLEVDEESQLVRYYNLRKASKDKGAMVFIQESLLQEKIDDKSLTVDGETYDVRDLIKKYVVQVQDRTNKNAPPCGEWKTGRSVPPCGEWKTGHGGKIRRFQNR